MGHASLSPLLEGLVDQLHFAALVDLPEAAFAGLFLRARHFHEETVQRQVVANRVLEQQCTVTYRTRKINV